MLSDPALGFGYKQLLIIWLLEWIILVLESRGLDPARETVLAFIRRAEHQELGMTHLCCRPPLSRFENFRTSWPTRESDIDEILEEESDFSKMLDNKMQEVSAKELSSLLKVAIFYDKDLLGRSRKHAERKEKVIWGRRPSGFDVDHRNDRFVPRYSDVILPDPIPGITIDISKYAGWMERRFRTRDSSQSSLCREQYFRRLSWLYYIGDLYGISLEDIVREMKRADPWSDTVTSVSPEEDQDIRNFRASWEEWSAQGPVMQNISTVGFANWPFVEADE
ncbi:hypothetical protein NM208_g11186 [Fusarium decemcellulare]|uniref:Uncharacterized protein n=1 Tax=Fusarium decemcellulare TaxID=57161 RepID=A0ACC1RV90_9HYPO|nr:hypothetical protein NM208_g11186 [Fusarium decemcellulare]